MITDIDMHLRDTRLLLWLTGRSMDNIPRHMIADEMGCSVQTAGAMLKRLERGGYIKIVKGSKRYGYRYIVIWSKAQ